LSITLASDAHVPALVGHGFEEAVGWARRAGYGEAVWFEARAARAYALEGGRET
jgi:histidinol phosphatase-like PHP family hydrolase